MEIDLYEFKETLKKLDDEDYDFLEFDTNKGVAIVEVGKASKEINERLIELGYKKGEKVLVVIQ